MVLQISIVLADLIANGTLWPVETAVLLHRFFRGNSFHSSLVSAKVVAFVKKLLQLIPLHIAIVDEVVLPSPQLLP